MVRILTRVGPCTKFITCLIFLVGAATAPSLAFECRNIDGLDSILIPGGVLLLGELHGTVEGPRLVADISCHAINAGKGVTALLEIPIEEIGRVSTFLESDGKMSDKTDLLAGDFWQRSFQDGRSSEAMVDLLDTLRLWRRSGHSLRLALIDSEPASGQEREEVMAKLFHKAIQKSPRDFFIALVGNIHNRLVPVELPGGKALRPMAQILAESAPDLSITSLNLLSAGGTAWYCAPECGIKRLRLREEGAVPRVVLEQQLPSQPFHGKFYIGRITASMPAVTVLLDQQ